MFAEIAVDTYQDPTKKLFTYEIPKRFERTVKLGDLVKIPFGKRVVDGFLYQLTTRKPKIRTKPITAVKKRQALTETQVKLAHWLSTRYAAPPLDCLKCQIAGRGERYTEGKEKEITTLLLVPYTTKVKLKVLELTPTEKKVTLVGSRSAVFATLPNLKKIVIEEPENWAYKDERSPYYHAKDVALKRAGLEGLKVEKRYLVPRVEDLFREKLSPLRIRRKINIIDLTKERDAGNFSPLSSELTAVLRKAKRALLYVISKEVEKEINKAVMAEGLDKNRIEVAGPEIFAAVGKTFEVVSLADTDTLLNLPNFRAHEKLVLTTVRLGQLTKGRIFLQTANPSHPLFAELKTGNLESFYQRELATRKPLLYPPFGVLAKLEFSTKKSIKVNFEAGRLYDTLTKKFQNVKGIKISPPYPPYTRSRGKAQLNLALGARNYQQLNKMLDLVPPTWKIIVDPEGL